MKNRHGGRGPLHALAFGLFGTCAALAPTWAQDAADGDADELTEVVVTGSRIRMPGFESPVPVTSVLGTEITQTGNFALGDLLNDLPALRNTFSQANSTRFIGTAGVNFLDLRGLGLERTLVLQNGRRHVSASPGLPRVDVNTIPIDLVERIDVVTGGTSAVYGSDAVAGVVNFVLKDDFEGLQARFQPGISSRGDRFAMTASLTGGLNFAEDRGNFAASIEYNRADALDIVDRPRQTGAIDGRTQFQLFENPAGETGGTDGIPDRILLGGIKNLGLSEGGTFIASSGTASAVGACATAAGCIGPLATGVPRIYRFQPNGTLFEANYGTDLRPQTASGSGNAIGGDGTTLRRYGQLAPFVERYGVNILSHFDVSEALTPYLEAKYVRYDIFQEGSPTFQAGGTQTGTVAAQGGFAGANSTGVPIRLDNPFLNPAAASLIASVLPAGQQFFRLQRNNIDLGSRREEGFRETKRFVVGIKGDFNEDWSYDLSLNYGDYRQDLLSLNNRIQQRFRLATDAARNAAGQIVCRSQLPGVVTTPPAGAPAGDAAALAADIAACVPLNLFGEGAPSRAAIDYVNVDTRSRQTQEQRVALGYVTGDSSQLFELPGGPVGFALGAEWRQEDGLRDFGDIVASGRTFLTAVSTFDPPEKFEVSEQFLEFNAPLLADLPFAKELSVTAAGRLAQYDGEIGEVFAWNAGAVWAPVEDVRFRANYAVAVRAPTQLDLFASLGQNFAQLNDPCDVNFVNNGTATRIANCRADNIPAGFINAPARAARTAISTGGNRFLREETSKSWTVGAVFEPRFVPGLTLTLDYYEILIEDVIGSPTAQQILDNCYDGSSLDNVFCTVIRRDPSTRFFSTSAPEFALIEGGINYAKGTARGVDFEAAYRRDLGFGKVTSRLFGTYVRNRNDFPFINDPNRPDKLLGEVGDPRVQLNFALNLRTGPFDLGYQSRYIGKQAVASVGLGGGIEDISTVGGRPPQNADFADSQWITSAVYHDLRLGYEFSDRLDLYLGIDNVTNQLPPAGVLGNGSVYAVDAIWDNVGRYFYAGALIRF
ncbi:MAG: TonB-dependent receptor [Steroidobacteraceae bacterium]|nr:TonB-dependent receptor [Steroidobacteraceae bacterium]